MSKAAFPHNYQSRYDGPVTEHGLTKREYMATHLLAGMTSDQVLREVSPEVLTKAAVRLTDMLIKELEK